MIASAVWVVDGGCPCVVLDGVCGADRQLLGNTGLRRGEHLAVGGFKEWRARRSPAVVWLTVPRRSLALPRGRAPLAADRRLTRRVHRNDPGPTRRVPVARSPAGSSADAVGGLFPAAAHEPLADRDAVPAPSVAKTGRGAWRHRHHVGNTTGNHRRRRATGRIAAGSEKHPDRASQDADRDRYEDATARPPQSQPVNHSF